MISNFQKGDKHSQPSFRTRLNEMISGINSLMRRMRDLESRVEGQVIGEYLFPVKLTVENPSATGNATTQCAFTYTLKDPNDATRTYATGVTPLKPRPTYGKMTSGNGKIVLAGMNAVVTGSISAPIYLPDAFEVQNGSECAT